MEEAILFCQRHLAIAARIPRDRLEREALFNALCHREYSQQGAAISLAIFDDRLELWSEGGLPFGLEPEALKREHASRPRNLLIADVFFRRGLIERWGRGTQVILEECERAGCTEPSYWLSGSCFVVTFPLESGAESGARWGEMGRCAAITRRENGYLCGTGSMFLRPLKDTLVPEYLAALLSSKNMRSKLERVAIGTTLLNLNSIIVGDVLIPVPPIELQFRYARFLARLDAIGDITSRSSFACSAVLASIQNSIFPIAGS